MLNRAGVLLALSLLGCTVGDRYLIAPETLASINAVPAAERAHTVAPAHRSKTGREANVLTHSFSLTEASTRSDGQVLVANQVLGRHCATGQRVRFVAPLHVRDERVVSEILEF